MTKLSHNQLRAIWGAIDFKVGHLEKLNFQMLPFVPPKELAAYNKIIDNVYEEIGRLNEARAAISKVYEELLKNETKS